MNPRRPSVWFSALVLSGLGTWAAFGQGPEKTSPPVIPPPLEKTPPRVDPPGEGDPTQPGPALKEILNKNKQGPATTTPPKIELKGRVVGTRRPATALLDIAGRTYVVTVESQLTTPTMNLRILSIDTGAVVIELLPSKEKLVLR